MSASSVSRLIITVLLISAAGPLSAITGPRLANVTISQVYGGGGNAGATYANDFVELHNPGIRTVNLNGWAIQDASAAGTTWLMSSLPNITIAPGGYILIGLGTNGPIGAPLPGLDATASGINMSQTAGKVAVTIQTIQLSGACPVGLPIQDMVGYGIANCYEGTAAAPAPSSSTAVKRIEDGCGDTDANNTDFSAVSPTPRNSLAAPNVCEATVNETDAATEADYCVLQSPTNFSAPTGTTTPGILAQIYEAGTTEMMGANATVTGQIGYGAIGIDPATQAGFTWFAAAFNTQAGNNDEYQASFTAPAPGYYRYGARFTLDGVNWTYCDVDGAGSNPSLTFSAFDLGVMTSAFTDEPVVAGGAIKLVHLAELRQAVNAARQANSLTVYAFTDDPLVARATPIRAVHITQLRLALQEVYDQRLITRPTYGTDPSLSTGTTIRAAHINELRSAVRGVQ